MTGVRPQIRHVGRPRSQCRWTRYRRTRQRHRSSERKFTFETV